MPVEAIMRRRGAGRLAFRVGTGRVGVSGVLRPRLLGVGLAVAALAATAFCLAVGLGSGDYVVAPARLMPALLGSGDGADVLVVRELRLPRAAVAALAGAALGMSGALFQTITRNPLASPDVLGITQGAGAAVAAGVVFGVGAGGTHVLGLAGALAAGIAIYVLAWKRGTTGYRIVLVGIGVSWMCVSLTTYLLSRTEIHQAQRILGWLVGSLDARGWAEAVPLALALAVLAPTAMALDRPRCTLGLGDDVAAGLGTAVSRVRFASLACGAALAAFATAAVGPVLFVALASPQIALRLAGTATPPVLCAAGTGSTVVLLADLIGQRLLEDGVVPVGVVTGALGAPFLLWRLARADNAGSGGRRTWA